ncbi:hypothetical protein ACTWP4_04350 [Gracilibacillus sp. D59]|uniref:hypothetical protein n=1 Tax=Gracilibacillus sp. D59 TaxID=3457434 RepID=UPI003FCD99D0
MPRENQAFSKVLKQIHVKFRYFTENYMTAVKKGANVAEKEIKKAVEDRDQPFEVIVIKLFEAIKKGVLYAARQMIDFGVNIVETKEKSRKK